ncbi:RNA-binding protein 20 isoform X1 [Pseudochaenichthys georgianus]|uniref:RNA-binding protein 20 isoform X1 n=1 Tax=Pseudochaenichthys georgianus TaxID=52239 RepID=UPI00146A0E37|nr:RNA-binding protein 20 isoform X1 [Pseudochaenichthys georgianus]
MQQAWDRTSSTERVKRDHTKMLGKGQSGGYPPETTSELLQSINALPLDSSEKKSFQVGAGGVHSGPHQQNQQLFLTPASLQLAQLQAQLTLHRLKLAQGGNSANAATLLNQVLSNVAMSQPLFNQLRTSSMVGNPQGGFPTGVLGFSSSNSSLGALVGGGFNQNPGNVRLNHPGGGGTVGQQGAEYGKTSGSTYPSDTDRRVQYNLGGGTSTASATAGDGQYTMINTQAKNMSNVGFQRDFYGRDMLGQQAGFSVNDQKVNVYNSKEQWKGPANLSHTGKVDMVSNAANMWTAAGQPIRSRTELYNPEEPTPDPKFNHISGVSSFSSSGTQGFGGYQPLHGSDETLSSGTRTLQPYQVNDYHAVTPTQLPHQCSICDKKVYNLKDWDQHVKGKLHLQNRTLYANESSAVVSAGAVHYSVGRPSDGGLNAGGTSSMVYSSASQDVSTGANASYLPAAAMKIYPTSDTGFSSHQPESKATIGRVVHICNLPEGSCTENDVIHLGIPFGKVTNYILMRSTHQAFLEMAYVEAAQAMVQYYQLTPATINNQKLLIRMSKRYKELQLKKPGKDVQTIIHDITSQQERDEMQEHEHYIPERARSRSPISRSLSPHSHSPSFTSCSSAHSPQGASCRGPERGSNGMGPRQGSWDRSSHLRRGEDDREREDPWRNEGSVDDDRPSGRAADRRKVYQKPLDHISSRSADERGGGGGEGIRGNRDWQPRGSPQGMSFNSYRNMDDDIYMKEQMYKSDKPPRPPYQRHDTKPKRRDGGDYHNRSRHSVFEITEEPLRRTLEDKRPGSPDRGKGKKTSRRHTTTDKHDKENATENTERQSKEKSFSPQQSDMPKETIECSKERNTVKEWESGDDTDGDCWYPKNMEELVTVDEVGGEDDSIVEPDLPELEEFVSRPQEPTGEEAGEECIPPPTPSSLEVQETSSRDIGHPEETSVNKKPGNVISASSPEEQMFSATTPELPVTDLSDFPSEEFKAALEETCLEDKVTRSGPSEELMENHIYVSQDGKHVEVGKVPETINNGVHHKDSILKKEIEAPSPSREQDKAVSEHGIPLGVEFIVPRTGFYCKLCELFYNSEETAKSTHCRSTVHYRNLQKYLSQLAEDGLSGLLSEPSATQ